jgi:arylsulfatase A-like enzyme
MKPIRNIIYIHTHDMGRYNSAYGHAIPTPHLRKFAEQGTLFRQAFCCGPTCSPSRTGLLTGMTPHQAGMLGLAHRGFKLVHPEHHLAAFLRRGNFETALSGVQHEFGSPDQLPYERIIAKLGGGEWIEQDRATARAAAEFLEKDHDRPFFLSCGFFYPHRVFINADKKVFNPNYIRPPAPLPDLPAIREDMADYHYSVSVADECIGLVTDAIRRSGREGDSLVIITTDHGIAFPKMKCHLTDHGIGVTLMMNYPGNPLAGKAVDALVSHIDLYPTICDLLGLTAPGHLQGRSLRPIFEGSAEKVRDEIFSEVTFHAAYEPMRCVRTDRYKLIRRFDYPRHPLSNCDECPSKTVLYARGWPDDPQPEVQLYDLIADPNEARNLAGSPALASVQKDLEGRLADWMRRTDDPLLRGHVAIPPGAVMNTVDSYDPVEGPFEVVR